MNEHLDNEDYKPIEPVEFEFQAIENGKEVKKKFLYDYRLVTIEQAESAIAVAQFRNDQLEFRPANVEEVIKSNGHKYITNAVKYLLVEIQDGKPMPFEELKVKQVYGLLNSAKIADGIRDKEVEVYNDFFTAAGLKSLLLTTQKIERRAKVTSIMLSVLENMQRESISKKLQGITKELPDATKKTNSRRGLKKQ